MEIQNRFLVFSASDDIMNPRCLIYPDSVWSKNKQFRNMNLAINGVTDVAARCCTPETYIML